MLRPSLCAVSACGLALAGAGAGAADASVLNGSIALATPDPVDNVTVVDLTAEGTTDWAYFDATDGSGPGNASTTNRKAGGASVLGLEYSDPDANTNNGVNGQNVNFGFSYTDGTLPTAEAVSGGSYGVGIQDEFADIDDDTFVLSVLAGSTGPQRLKFYGLQRRTNTFVSASLAGSASDAVTLDTASSDDNGTGFTGSENWIYTLDFQADNASDVLAVSFSTNTPGVNLATSGNNSLRLAAVTVAAVPEPASLALVGLGGVCLLGRRRKAATA